MRRRATSSGIGIESMAPSSCAECAPWASGTSPPRWPRLGRMALPNGLSDRSGASVWTISSSWVRRICAGSCEPMLAITTTSERSGHWTKMRQSLARFSRSEASNRTQSLAAFITTMSGLRFSVHTALNRHCPFGRARKGRKHQAFDHEDQPERGQEIATKPRSLSLFGGRRRVRRHGTHRLAGRVVEVAEEVAVRIEHQAGIVRLQPVLIGLHRAVEREEVRVLVEGVGEDLVARGVAFAADLLRLGGRVGDQHGHFTVGLGADFLRLL